MIKRISPLLLLSFASLFTIVEYFLLSFTFQKYPDIHALTAYFWGFLGGVSVLCFLLLVLKKHRNLVIENFPKYWKWAMILSGFLLSAGILWFYAIGNAPAGIIAFLENLTIPFSFFFGIVFLRERFSAFQFSALFLSGIGFFLMFHLNENIALLPLFSIISMAFVFTLQSFLVKKYMQDFDFLSFTYIRNILTTVLVIPVLYLLGHIELIPVGAVLLFTAAALLGFFIARIFYFEAHKHVSLGAIHFFGLVEPVAVLFLSVAFLHEELSLQKIFAAIVVLSGLFLFFHAEKKIK